MKISYKPKGICAVNIKAEVNNGIVGAVSFTGGCDGNHKGICSLVQGMKAEDAIEKLRGIRCGFKSSSCPDQLSYALEEAVKREKEESGT